MSDLSPPPPSAQPDGAPPDNGLVLAVLSTVFCCLPIGIVAVVHSARVDGLWAQGRHAEAHDAAKKARLFAAWSAAAAVGVVVLWVLFAAVLGVGIVDMLGGQ